MRKLVLIHGRSQQNRDPRELKQKWLDALHTGLQAAGLDFEIPDNRVAFPYYGNTLDIISGDPTAQAPDVILAGFSSDAAERAFVGSVVSELVERHGVTDSQIQAEAGGIVIEAGPLNWPWVLAALRVLETVPGVSAVTLSLVTRDVWMYLRNLGIQRLIDNGVRAALSAGEETIVVSHSLGTVIAYNLLGREAQQDGWLIPTFVTVGSPLGVRAIVELLRPISHPVGVGDWFNAYDPQDTVALHPLDAAHFPITPGIENYDGVVNPTDNQHGISGYLSDPTVARRIHHALFS